MGLVKWSEEIMVVELGDGPQFTDDMTGLMDILDEGSFDVVLNFGAVGFINSSDIARLLRLRKKMLAKSAKLIISDVTTQVQGLFQVTGLDRIFEFTNDVSTALAMLQMSTPVE